MPTTLSTQQRRRLHDALLDTFKDIDDLEQLATYGLDANLSAIVVVHGRNLTKIVADLIRWSESEPGGIHRLIAAALDRVPESHELKTIADEWAEIEFRVRPSPESEQASKGIHLEHFECHRTDRYRDSGRDESGPNSRFGQDDSSLGTKALFHRFLFWHCRDRFRRDGGRSIPCCAAMTRRRTQAKPFTQDCLQ